MPSSRFLAIIDKNRIDTLLAQGELFIGIKELRELDNPMPDALDYTDLLSDNYYFKSLEDKLFLVIGLIEKRDADYGLEVSISEIEYLVTLSNEASAVLEKEYPALNFQFLPPFIMNNFANIKLRKEASLGVGALRVIMNLETVNQENQEPFLISSDSLLDIIPDIPSEIITGLSLRKQGIPYYQTNLIQRTLLALTMNYERTQPYPEGDIGYFFDMLEIFHYVTNREDNTPPSIEKPTFRRDIYEGLMSMYQQDPQLELLNIAAKLDQNTELYGKFINLITNLTQGNHFLVPFVYLKAVSRIKKYGASSSLIMGIASDLVTRAEKENFAIRLGSSLGYKALSGVLYKTLSLPILHGMLDLENVDNGFEIDNLPEPEEAKEDAPLGQVDFVNNTLERIIKRLDTNTAIPNADAVNDQINQTPDISSTTTKTVGFGIKPLTTGYIDLLNEIEDSSYDNEATVYNISFYLDQKSKKEVNTESTAKNSGRIELFDDCIVHQQKKITNYLLCNLSGFEQALALNPVFTAATPKEIQAALTSIIKNEAPINRALIISRFKLLCKNAKSTSRFSKAEKAKLELELHNLLKSNSNFVEEDGFIYRAHQQIYVRFRGHKDIHKALRSELRKAENISPKEIVASYNLLLQFGIGFAEPSANEVVNNLGLSETADNIAYIEKLIAELKEKSKGLAS